MGGHGRSVAGVFPSVHDYFFNRSGFFPIGVSRRGAFACLGWREG